MVQPAGLDNVPQLLQQLPELFLISDIAFYLSGILFFGSIVMIGWRGHMKFLPHFGLRLLMGGVSMIGGVSLRGFFPSEGILQLLLIDVLAGSLVTSIILGLGLFMISYSLINVNTLLKQINDMQVLIKKAKSFRTRLGWKDPVKFVGIAIILIVVVVGIMGFRGFPVISDNFVNFVGLTPEEISDLGKTLATNTPEGCVSILTILQITGPDITTLPVSSDDDARALVEQESGSTVVDAREVVIDGEIYVLSVTQNAQLCSVRPGQFCGCIDLSGYI